ncbi:TPA: hypothetical protein ACG2L8_002871 [Legionella pneumophila]
MVINEVRLKWYLRQLNTELNIDNLYLLDEHHFYQFSSDEEVEFSLYGLGGSFLVSKKLFDKSISGNGGKIKFAK